MSGSRATCAKTLAPKGTSKGTKQKMSNVCEKGVGHDAAAITHPLPQEECIEDAARSVGRARYIAFTSCTRKQSSSYRTWHMSA